MNSKYVVYCQKLLESWLSYFSFSSSQATFSMMKEEEEKEDQNQVATA